MPVFDFSDTPKKEEEPQCTYTVYCSNEPAASPVKPMLVLDNSIRAWKHHSCGVFTNQAKRTAFEFKEEDGTVSAVSCRLTPASPACCAGWGKTISVSDCPVRTAGTDTRSIRFGRWPLEEGPSCLLRTVFSSL